MAAVSGGGMRKIGALITGLATLGCLLLGIRATRADEDRSPACRDVPSHAVLGAALEAA